MARRMWRRWAGRSSWLSVRRCRIAANASPGRPITLSSMAWLTVNCDVSGSGSASISRSNVGLPYPIEPSGGFFRTTLRRFFGSSPAFASARSLSITCSGAWTTTVPIVSYRAPGAPGDLVELAGFEQPGLHTVVLGQSGEQHRADRHVDPDAEGVGPADHLEQPGLGERLHQPAVLRQHPGVVHADAMADQPG